MGRTYLTGAMSVMVLVAFAACGGGESSDAPAPAAGTPEPSATPAQTTNTQAAALPAGVTQADVDAGRDLFNGAAICFTCHGQNGTNGALAPDLTDDEWLNIDSRDLDAIIGIINTGVATPKQFTNSQMMPRAGTPITDEQVRQIAAYVVSLGGGS